jgi:hypothetical protein
VGLRNWARYGNSTPEERNAKYPCDCYVQGSARPYLRAIDVKANPDLTYRWVCQLTVAPYSYDLIDNLGRRSPRELTPGADGLKVGDEFMICTVRDLEPGRVISGVTTPRMEKVFGPVALTYAVVPQPDGNSRIAVKMWLGARGRLGGLKRAALVFGDAVMMRKQLTTLRDLAERDQRRLARS